MGVMAVRTPPGIIEMISIDLVAMESVRKMGAWEASCSRRQALNFVVKALEALYVGVPGLLGEHVNGLIFLFLSYYGRWGTYRVMILPMLPKLKIQLLRASNPSFNTTLVKHTPKLTLTWTFWIISSSVSSERAFIGGRPPTLLIKSVILHPLNCLKSSGSFSSSGDFEASAMKGRKRWFGYWPDRRCINGSSF
jgi:hypothetical protein